MKYKVLSGISSIYPQRCNSQKSKLGTRLFCLLPMPSPDVLALLSACTQFICEGGTCALVTPLFILCVFLFSQNLSSTSNQKSVHANETRFFCKAGSSTVSEFMFVCLYRWSLLNPCMGCHPRALLLRLHPPPPLHTCSPISTSVSVSHVHIPLLTSLERNLLTWSPETKPLVQVICFALWRKA